MYNLYKVYSVMHDVTGHESDTFQYPVIPLSKSRLYAGIAHAACYRIKFTVAGFTGAGGPMQPCGWYLCPLADPSDQSRKPRI
jgi:hypothetical protein